MILFDTPQIAYKSWGVQYYILEDDGTRDYQSEREMEDSLQKRLPEYRYSPEHDHVGW